MNEGVIHILTVCAALNYSIQDGPISACNPTMHFKYQPSYQRVICVSVGERTQLVTSLSLLGRKVFPELMS